MKLNSKLQIVAKPIIQIQYQSNLKSINTIKLSIPRYIAKVIYDLLQEVFNFKPFTFLLIYSLYNYLLPMKARDPQPW